MKLGQVVLSRCGRDKEKYFVVIGIDEKEEYVYLADGFVRKIERPKKKKLKHVTPLHIDEALSEKLVDGTRISNSEIKKCLNSLNQQNAANSYNNKTEELGG